jgi:CRISPR/Cas system-associated exonuclease Cas4 (RecB family)
VIVEERFVIKSLSQCLHLVENKEVSPTVIAEERVQNLFQLLDLIEHNRYILL